MCQESISQRSGPWLMADSAGTQSIPTSAGKAVAMQSLLRVIPAGPGPAALQGCWKGACDPQRAVGDL